MEQKRAVIIALANQKGGVGKTTSAVNLSASVGLMGKRVLMVDLDPQGNTTSGFGISKKTTLSSYELLIGAADIHHVTIKTQFANLSIVPAQISLAGAEFELVVEENRETRLKTALEPVIYDYDYIFIDCPPSLGILTINALVAATGYIVPMQCEYYALEGLSQLMMSVKKIKTLYNSQLTLVGILITMYNGRLNLSVQVLEELKKYYKDQLFHTPVARNVRLSEAPSFGMPVYYYDKNSKGALAYLEIARELLQRI